MVMIHHLYGMNIFLRRRVLLHEILIESEGEKKKPPSCDGGMNVFRVCVGGEDVSEVDAVAHCTVDVGITATHFQ